MKSANFQHYLEYVGYRLLEELVSRMPARLILPAANGLAFFVYKILRIRRQVSLENLETAFPEKTLSERERIAYQSYRHFILLIFEFWKLWRWDLQEIQNMVDSRSDDLIRQLTTENRGTMVLAAHFGNWEIGAAYLTAFWRPFLVIQKRQYNRLVDRRMAELRKRWGMEIIYSRGAVRKAIHSLKNGHSLALLVDQDSGPRGVFVPFFGKMASTAPGAAIMHLKTGAPMVVGSVIRIAPFRYQLKLVPVSYRGPMKIQRENIEKITRSFTAVIESQVRQHPEQYFWMHKRWKSVHKPATVPNVPVE